MSTVQANEATIQQAAELIAAGGLVAFPTETVYGLGADACNGVAVASIYQTKGRPSFNPLIVHVEDAEKAAALAQMNDAAQRLTEAFWPGPLTLVLALRASSGLSDLVTAGLPTVAIRVPSHPVARALIAAAGCPIAAPSANVSGHVSPTCAAHVEADFGDHIAMILDGGRALHGLESTILDASREGVVRILRPGAIGRDEIAACVGAGTIVIDWIATKDDNRPSSPGQLESHYAPRAGVRCDVTEVHPGEALLAFGAQPLETNGPVVNLSESGSVVEAAAGLFAALRALDQCGAHSIAVMPIPHVGVGIAINDRLSRAAAPRGTHASSRT